MSQKVLIVGAGIGGLATANLLQKAGLSVTVIEKETEPGGRAGRRQNQGFTFDTGPSWFLMPDVFAHYYALLEKDVHDELDLVRLSPAYKVFFEHASPIVITSDIDNDAATFDAIEPGAGAALRRYVLRSDEIYQLSLRHFLYSNFLSPWDIVNRHIIRHAMRMTKLAFTSMHRYVSMFVKDLRLRQILEYPMVFLGTSPFRAPAIYTLMSALDFKEGVYYPQGGIYTIIESLVRIGTQLGVTYVNDAEVTHIRTHSGRATGAELADGTFREADLVISNADMHFTETQLLDSSVRSFDASYWASKEPSPSALLLYLGIRGKIPEFEHHNLLFVDAWKDNFEAIYTMKLIPQKASIYICKASQTDSHIAPAGDENIFVLVPLPAGVSVSDAQVRELRDRYLAQIAEMTGVDLAGRVVVEDAFGPDDFKTRYFSWQSSMLGQSHKLTQSAFFRTPNKSRRVANLYYVGGSTTPGIGLPMCLIGAELIYKRLAGDGRTGRVSHIRSLTDMPE